jgi:hypothetical protein
MDFKSEDSESFAGVIKKEKAKSSDRLTKQTELQKFTAKEAERKR